MQHFRIGTNGTIIYIPSIVNCNVTTAVELYFQLQSGSDTVYQTECYKC